MARNRFGNQKANMRQKMARQGTEGGYDRSALFDYFKQVSNVSPKEAEPEKHKPELFDYIIYRATRSLWVAMKKRPNETNSQIARRIADYENKKREWARPIRAGDFSYVIMRQFPNIRSARDAAKIQGDALIQHKSPLARNKASGNHI